MRGQAWLLSILLAACGEPHGHDHDHGGVPLRRVDVDQLRGQAYSAVVVRGQVFRLWIRSTPDLPKRDRGVAVQNTAAESGSELVVYFHHLGGVKHMAVVGRGDSVDSRASGERAPLMEVVVLERVVGRGSVDWRLT